MTEPETLPIWLQDALAAIPGAFVNVGIIILGITVVLFLYGVYLGWANAGDVVDHMPLPPEFEHSTFRTDPDTAEQIRAEVARVREQDGAA